MSSTGKIGSGSLVTSGGDAEFETRELVRIDTPLVRRAAKLGERGGGRMKTVTRFRAEGLRPSAAG
jgi:hypothetical protein